MVRLPAFFTPAHARACLLVLLSLWAGLHASPTWGQDDDDHERARLAVQSGEVLPLQAVLQKVARTNPGEVMEVELESEHGRWVYEIKLLKPDGRLVKLEIDARTAAVLNEKMRGRSRGR